MVWDLGRAMRKKGEFESARLMQFEFRQRARAARLLARKLALDEATFARLTVTASDEEVLNVAATESGRSPDEVTADFYRCAAIAREQLIVERGDPTPYRLG